MRKIESLGTLKNELMDSITTLDQKVKVQVEALEYKISKLIKEKATSYNSSYFQKAKVMQHLIAGCHKKEVANNFASFIVAGQAQLNEEKAVPYPAGVKVNVAAEDFDGASFQIWNMESDMGKKLLEAVQQQKECIDQKRASMLETIKLKENAKWNGTVASLKGVDYNCLKFLVAQNVMSSEADDAEAFAYLLKNNSRRYGPLALPSPGVPSLLMFEQDCYVFASCATGLQTEACMAIEDYESFAGSPKGDKWYLDEVTKMYVPANTFLYIPVGQLMHMIHYKTLGTKTKKPKH